ncbi:Bug family tripartite tricarboxylate transporter substrate binding protein [Comamonas composti]|uniref:Bug family tripartite tricarboxylate transporter substrate binding protein n=1 Tax=Comamonas composti TaxID=408558 RepID=UPI000A0625DF|nr:tripartite tricarboxylate transporter substrate binding protein [Comamonas composti]
MLHDLAACREPRLHSCVLRALWESDARPQPTRRQLLQAGGLFAGLAALPAGAQSTAAPGTHGLTLIIPFAPEGPADRLMRQLLAAAGQELGPVKILHVPGESGAKGTAMVARASAQDQVLLLGSVSTFAVKPWLQPQQSYDALRDFHPLLLLSHMPNVLVMSSAQARQWRIQSPLDLQRFLARQRKPLRFASSGTWGLGHLTGEMYQMLTRLPLQHLPFSGVQPALSALLEGSADLMFDNLASSLPHIRAGRLQAIAVTTSQPSPLLPGVPCLNESIPGLDTATWFGLFAPASWGGDQAHKLAQGFARALQRQPVQDYLATQGGQHPPVVHQEFARFVQAEHGKYGQLARNAQQGQA